MIVNQSWRVAFKGISKEANAHFWNGKHSTAEEQCVVLDKSSHWMGHQIYQTTAGLVCVVLNYKGEIVDLNCWLRSEAETVMSCH